MWFKKVKEQKIQNKQQEVDDLNKKYKSEIGSYCKMGEHIFVLLGFEVYKDEVSIKYRNAECVEGYYKIVELDLFAARWGHVDFKMAKYNFDKFKEDLKKIGLKLEK